MSDLEYMSRAIRLASKGRYTTRPNPNVGCVIVNQGEVVGEGYHRKAGEAHAEVNALLQAGSRAEGSNVYVTLEPCSHTGKTPPCADALVNAGVAKVVVAMTDPNPMVAGRGLTRLREAGIEVVEGVMENSAHKLNPGFIKRMQTNLPYVRVKLAMSLDGRTAMASGESKWITGAQSRADVHRLRALSGCMLTGSGTVIEDNPSMQFRVADFPQLVQAIPVDTQQPMRVIVDSARQVPLNSKIFGSPGHVAVATVTGDDLPVTDSHHIEQLVFAPKGGKVPLKELMHRLAEMQINDVMVEAGAGLCGALLQQQLVDEMVIYMAPHIMGDSARGLFTIPGLETMQDRIGINIQDIRAIGQDWRITVVPEYP